MNAWGFALAIFVLLWCWFALNLVTWAKYIRWLAVAKRGYLEKRLQAIREMDELNAEFREHHMDMINRVHHLAAQGKTEEGVQFITDFEPEQKKYDSKMDVFYQEITRIQEAYERSKTQKRVELGLKSGR